MKRLIAAFLSASIFLASPGSITAQTQTRALSAAEIAPRSPLAARAGWAIGSLSLPLHRNLQVAGLSAQSLLRAPLSLGLPRPIQASAAIAQGSIALSATAVAERAQVRQDRQQFSKKVAALAQDSQPLINSIAERGTSDASLRRNGELLGQLLSKFSAPNYAGEDSVVPRLETQTRRAASALSLVTAVLIVLGVAGAPGAKEPPKTHIREAYTAYQFGNYKIALQLARHGAESGNANAQNLLGSLYYQGRGVPKDHAQALAWFRKAQAQKQPSAYSNLGLMHYYGHGVAKDLKEAARLFKEASDRGDLTGQYNLALMILNGQVAPADIQEAMKLLRKASSSGHIKAQSLLGRLLYNAPVTHGGGQTFQQGLDEAFKWAQLAAKNGDAEAALTLGMMYEGGRGAKPNQTEATNWYRKAAEGGSAGGQWMLGIMHYQGEGTPKDILEAMKWMLLANKNGYPIDQDTADFINKIISDMPDKIPQIIAFVQRERERHPNNRKFTDPLKPLLNP